MFRLAVFKTWVEDVERTIDTPMCLWSRVGRWAFPTRDNGTWSEVIIHYCYEYYLVHDKMSHVKTFNGCRFCGEDAGDGMRMIALLEKL